MFGDIVCRRLGKRESSLAFSLVATSLEDSHDVEELVGVFDLGTLGTP